MRKIFLMLDKINDVKDFVNISNKFTGDVYVQRNEYVVDAKSILGLYSLDLSKPICFISNDDIPENLYNELKKFSVEGD